MTGTRDTQRSLEELQPQAWAAPDDRAPPSMHRCHQLRKVPIGNLAPGDIQLLLTYGVGTDHLMPLAISLLTDAPLIEGNHYPGDLLSSAVQVEDGYWLNHSDQRAKLGHIVARAIQELGRNDILKRDNRQLLRDLSAFRGASDA